MKRFKVTIYSPMDKEAQEFESVGIERILRVASQLTRAMEPGAWFKIECTSDPRRN